MSSSSLTSCSVCWSSSRLLVSNAFVANEGHKKKTKGYPKGASRLRLIRASISTGFF
ncbi:hypothetical protein AMTR_s00075p00090320 [Amborella trichopoda]|uniref:Uncharacterized protein n=1 Tax=Amborella trichopoda TaxID=13333 RepID=W1PAF7_AMBTC|nr:hypothetical protein AMTR_s00075p00090320 [Amborella trichopoda]